MATDTTLEEIDPASPRDLYDVPKGYELIDGELVEMPAMGAESSWVLGRMFRYLDRWCEERTAGVAITGEAGYQCFPDRPGLVRKPDVSVILCDPASFVPPKVNLESVPDLVVEVLSPHNEAADINAKTEAFLAAGTRLVWIIDPELRMVLVHRADGTVTKLRDPAELTGENVLPGFATPLAAFLPRRPATP